MRWLRLLGWLLLPSFALAQLRVVIVQPGAVERPIQSFEDLGSVPIGDTLDATFRVRNDSSSNVVLNRLTLAGAAFSIASQPAIPHGVPAGGSAEFAVRFSPSTVGSYSANLTVNEASYILRATAIAALKVSVEEMGRALAALRSGDQVSFGEVRMGATLHRQFVVENPTASALAVSIGVTGTGFRLNAPGLPEQLAPGQSATFGITYAPEALGPSTGSLRVDDRRFGLGGRGLERLFSNLQLSVDPASLGSGKQASVSIGIDGAVEVRSTGQLTLTFIPEVVDLPVDRAIQFATGGLTTSFDVVPGQTAASFGSDSIARFQTGTTAGTMVFQAQVAGRVAESRFTVAREPVGITTARASKSGNSLDVLVTGFDNTRTTSNVTFTFFDAAGGQIPQPVRVDASEGFRGYFRNSATGGTFSLRAVFPVTGNAGQIAAVEIEVLNAAGSARSDRVRF